MHVAVGRLETGPRHSASALSDTDCQHRSLEGRRLERPLRLRDQALKGSEARLARTAGCARGELELPTLRPSADLPLLQLESGRRSFRSSVFHALTYSVQQPAEAPFALSNPSEPVELMAWRNAQPSQVAFRMDEGSCYVRCWRVPALPGSRCVLQRRFVRPAFRHELAALVVLG